MSRVLAFLAAVALVAGAVVARGYLTGERTVPDGPELPGTSAEPLVLACPRLVAEACRSADLDDGVTVRVEAAGTTATSWAEGPQSGPDAWLVPEPWPGAADTLAGRQADEAAPVVAGLASSPLVIAVWEDRADALVSACGGSLTWRCVGEQAGTPWSELGATGVPGTVRPAHGDPRTDALGGVVLAQAAASFLQNPDAGSQQLQTPEFRSWFGDLERAVPSSVLQSSDLITDLRTQRKALADVAGLPAALVPEGTDLRVVQPAEPALAELVLAFAPRHSDAAAELGERLRAPLGAALAEAGWDTAETAAGTDDAGADDAGSAAAADDGLPSGGFLVALQEAFEETR